MLLLLLLLFIVPMMLERSGSNFDLIGWLIVRPSAAVTQFILNATRG